MNDQTTKLESSGTGDCRNTSPLKVTLSLIQLALAPLFGAFQAAMRITALVIFCNAGIELKVKLWFVRLVAVEVGDPIRLERMSI